MLRMVMFYIVEVSIVVCLFLLDVKIKKAIY